MDNDIRIIASPAFKDQESNPYTWLLYSQIRRIGIDVQEFSPQRLLTSKHSVWHLHWPEGPLNERSITQALLKSWAKLRLIDVARWKGTKIVWTIHNLAAHERLYPQFEDWFWQAFVSRLDGFISLSGAAMDAARDRFPVIRNLPGYVIPHGHYRNIYPDQITREEARHKLGIPQGAKVVTYLGQIRPYKNVPTLIRSFRGLQGDNMALLVAGKVKFPDLLAEIQGAACGDPRVRLVLDFVPTEEVQLYLRAADLTVLPYREILNSGSAILALSFDCPVLVPQKGSLAELQAVAGADWVRTYQGELTPEVLRHALVWAGNRRDSQPVLELLEWERLADDTIQAYRDICSAKS